MKSSLLSLVGMLCFAWAEAMAGVAAAYRVGATQLRVDGSDAGPVVRWEGGDLRAPVLTARAGAGGVTKYPGSPAIAPLVVRVAFPPSAVLASWINEVASGNSPRRTLVLVDFNAAGAPGEAYEISDALLTEIVIPAFDAAARSYDPMQLTFTGARGRAVAVPAGIASGQARKSTPGFQLSLAGLDGTGVSRIEAVTIKQPVTTAGVGGGRTGGAVAGPTEISNLKVTLSRATMASWRSWHTDYVVNSAGPGATKRDGAIALLDPTGTPASISLALNGCGILSLSRPPDAEGVAAKYVAEMFIERIAFGGLPPPVAGPAPAPASTPPPPDKPIAKEPAGPASPDDKGLRDPGEFPRVPNLVRLSYAGSYSTTSVSEHATYAAMEPAVELMERVQAAAKAAGWEMGNLSDSEKSGTRTIYQGWSKAKASASLTFYEKAGVKESQLDLRVTASK